GGGWRPVAAPSVSVPAARATVEGTGRGDRCQGRLHGEALTHPCASTPDTRRFEWADAERDRQSCGRGDREAREGTCLIVRPVSRVRCAWSIDSIDCQRRNGRGRTTCSRPPHAGRRDGRLVTRQGGRR